MSETLEVSAADIAQIEAEVAQLLRLWQPTPLGFGAAGADSLVAAGCEQSLKEALRALCLSAKSVAVTGNRIYQALQRQDAAAGHAVGN